MKAHHIISVLRILVWVFATSSITVRLDVRAGEMKLEFQQNPIIAPQFRPVRLPVNASASFSAAIIRQLAAVQSDSLPTDFDEKTIAYAKAKTAYFDALRAAMPELENIATGKKPRPRELDDFVTNFSVAGEKQEKAADDATLFLLKQLPFDPDVEKARAEFERAQKVEERFHHDFDGVDFTVR